MGSRWSWAARCSRRLGGDLTRPPGLGHPAGDVALAFGQRGDHHVRVAQERLELAVLVTQDAQHAGRLAQPGMRAAQDLLDVLGAPGQPAAELRDDQPQALADGQPQDVVDHVERDGRGRLLDGQRGAVVELAPRRALLTVDEVLADHRLLAYRAGRVGAERVEPRLGDLQLDARDRRAHP